MALADITIIRGDTYSFNVNFRDSNEDAIDITGWTIYFTVRRLIASSSVRSDSDAVYSKEITNGGPSGTVTIELSTSDTNQEPDTYKYDIQYKKPDGTVRSSDIYSLEIKEDITRSA